MIKKLIITMTMAMAAMFVAFLVYFVHVSNEIKEGSNAQGK